MLKVVLDTNVLVSALWTPAGNASTIINLVLTDRIIPCFDQRILNEYRAVLSRPRLAFPPGQADELLSEITDWGLSVIADIHPRSVTMTDESDRKFYDTAKFCEAYLITGNARHYPKDPLVINPARFLDIFTKKAANSKKQI
ncbi:MAG: putative toxin-antitoxin system toxin component, PIN family [Treponema sp.]|jgi:putative PIN family toxin of toxin-antitoxin system|nr:putative toxin-antitoxin system toxin component, PIN family [Treponema sp.]